MDSLFIFALFSLACAGTVPHGGNCSVANNRLDAATHKLLTDCDETTFCTPQNTCQPRQCRRDEFPFGYANKNTLPPLCPHGQYCPDEGSACTPQLSLGQACQLNRDGEHRRGSVIARPYSVADECAPPILTGTIVPSHAMDINPQSPMNVGEGGTEADVPICLNFICTWANATLGAPCINETTMYVGLGPRGTQFSATVTRDNCRRPGLFCGAGVCVRALELGQPCQRDQECISYNCNIHDICANPPAAPVHVPAWQYALTGVIVLIAMLMTCLILVLVHKRHRKMRYAEVREYYREQLGYRKSIIALHSAATGRSGESSVYGKKKDAFSGSASTVHAYGRFIDDDLARGKRRD